MCGIVGYIGKKSASKVLIDGLKKLEYRGYDSAGLCLKINEDLFLEKSLGSVSNLEEKIRDINLTSNTGIAHTRWATHGGPSKKNAHPHSSCSGDLVICHNGIIENYSILKTKLEKEGHKFSSDTDSEVIAHLIEKFYSGNIESALKKALQLVSGSYAVVVINKKEDKIVGARLGSPLVLGIGKDEMFLASDVTAFLDKTKKIVYLKDKEIVTIKKDKFRISKLNGEKVNPEIEEIKMDISAIEKKGYKHFMLKEIFEQPETISNVIRGRIKKDKIKLTLNFNIEDIDRIIITACGTSWHSALIAKHYIESLVKVPVEVDYASEFRYRDPIVDNKTLLIAISQSGETADTLAALREAKEKGAVTLGVINVIGSTMSRETDCGVYLYAGPEIGVASTKAFSSQVTALLLLSLYFRQEKGMSLDKDLLKEIKEFSKKIDEVLKINNDIKKIARKYKEANNFLYLGRQLNFPVALEGALKLKEISYIHAEGYPAAEIKHGPIALVDKKMPVVFVAPGDNLSEKILSNMEEIKSRDGEIIVFTDKVSKAISKVSKTIIKVPKCHKLLTPILYTVPLQLLAYHIADLKGLNVDKPRNLAKSVTVE
ncbi:glutamine--fructose-6-phosphate transaminase (isomerizing) [bacterium]|nr:glutamine--fructose-6-phosphate transaminase (isomerizing) [bacterium]